VQIHYGSKTLPSPESSLKRGTEEPSLYDSDIIFTSKAILTGTLCKSERLCRQQELNPSENRLSTTSETQFMKMNAGRIHPKVSLFKRTFHIEAILIMNFKAILTSFRVSNIYLLRYFSIKRSFDTRDLATTTKHSTKVALK